MGVLDAVGEVSRAFVDALREPNQKEALYLFGQMERIYLDFQPLVFSNSVLKGFRRKLDVARGILERARRDLLVLRIGSTILENGEVPESDDISEEEDEQS